MKTGMRAGAVALALMAIVLFAAASNGPSSPGSAALSVSPPSEAMSAAPTNDTPSRTVTPVQSPNDNAPRATTPVTTATVPTSTAPTTPLPDDGDGLRVTQCTQLPDGTVRWGATVTVDGESVLVGQTQPRGTVSTIGTAVGEVRAEIDATTGECVIDLLPDSAE